MSVKDGGPAFPQIETTPEWDNFRLYPNVTSSGGMSLRDYFAIRAPQPADAAIEGVMERERLANPHGDTYKPRRRSWLEVSCALRYEYADAMLAAREEP